MVLSVVTALALRCLVAKASVLSLLAIVPFPSNDSSVGWSRGLELVPAGLLALKHINDTPEVLKGHTLELVVKEGEGCGASVVVKDIYSLYQELQVVGGRKVVGVVGLPCSTPAGALSKLAGHVGLDVIQISGSSSPALSDRAREIPAPVPRCFIGGHRYRGLHYIVHEGREMEKDIRLQRRACKDCTLRRLRSC